MLRPDISLPSSVQQEVEQFALQFLREGRFNWDEPHTRAVVFYAVMLASQE